VRADLGLAIAIAIAFGSSACRGKAKIAEDAGQLDSGVDPAEQAAAYDKQCVAGDLEACRQLGTAYLEGKGVSPDLPRATALFTRACDGGNMAACNALGLQYIEGLGIQKNPQRAVEMYQKACNGGFKPACRNLGVALRDGRGVPADPVAATVWLDRACKGGVPFACTNAGDLDAVLAAKLGPSRMKQAMGHYKQGCEAGDPTACRQLGLVYLDGRGVPKSATAAAVWLQRACLPDEPLACRLLGALLLQGAPGLARDVERGKQLLTRACEAKDEEACRLLQSASEPPADAGVAPGSGDTAHGP
jgi:TPR repeat protein